MQKFQSTKFIIVVYGMTGSFILAGFGKMTPEIAGVITVCVGAYNIANGYISGKYAEQKNGE